MKLTKAQLARPTYTVVPAYGRDYTSAAAAIADWEKGRDFRISDISCPWDGSYCSKRDGINVRVRYDHLRKQTQVLGGEKREG